MNKIKKGFTIIELTLMLVIMSIAFMTLPMILNVSTNSIQNVADVKGFHHGAAKIRLILSKPWDENNVDDFDNSGIYYVLRTQESNDTLDVLFCDNDKNRSGHYTGMNRRMCENADASVILAQEAGDFDDMDDFNGDTDINIEGYDVITTVQYIGYQNSPVVADLNNTFLGGTTSNIKLITIEVRRDGNFITEYNYYATNIGLAKPFIKNN